jgi:hypothetical protein
MRRGAMMIELAAAVLGLTAVFALMATLADDRRRAGAVDRRAAELELAQNLLARARLGEKPSSPGWIVTVEPVADGIQRVEVAGPLGTRLVTLRRAAGDVHVP